MILTSVGMCLTRTTPKLSASRWSEIDAKVNDLIGPLHWRISNDETPTNVAAEELGEILSKIFQSEAEFEEVEKQFFDRKQSKSLEEARLLKRDLKKKANKKGATAEDKANWLKAVKLHALLLRKENEKTTAGQIKKQEKAYKRNFFKFAKEACDGTVGEERVQPLFNKEVADVYFKNKYGTAVDIDLDKLKWMMPTQPPTVPYDQSDIRPGDVKKILKSKSPNTAPGEDGLLYGMLVHLPSVHHILATLYNKTNKSCLAPSTWASSLVVLAFKDGDAADPAMFRMIALTSALGKLYHQIKADRMAKFMTSNGYIDEATQKAFIKNVNGCIEHIQVLSEVIQDAKHKKRTAHFSWFDLSDAYGSIPHKLIEHNMRHYNIPEAEIAYIMHLYSQLKGKIVTKEWQSDVFSFCKGIFTGDNYSPIIFNVVFQPLIDFIRSKKERMGYMLGSRKVITKPFADDFEIITSDLRQHQMLQNEVQENAASMGLVFKPSKCRSLSICGGKPTPVSFFLTDLSSGEKVQLKTLESDPHKFLGCI